MRLGGDINIIPREGELLDIMKMRREKFHFDIRKERINQIFKEKRCNFQRHQNQAQINLDPYISELKESLKNYDDDKFNEILLIYEKLSYSQMEQFQIECIQGEIISLLIKNLGNSNRQTRINVCYLLTLICSGISEYEEIIKTEFQSQFFKNIQTFNKEIAEIIVHQDSQLREQGLQLLLVAVIEIPTIGGEFLNPENLQVVIKAIESEKEVKKKYYQPYFFNQFFKDIRELIHVLVPQLAKYSIDKVEPILIILDRYLFFDDKEVQIGVIRTLKRLLNKQIDQEIQSQLAKRYFELSNFKELIPRFQSTCFYGVVVELLLVTYGSVENFLEYSKDNQQLKILNFGELLDLINTVIISFPNISYLAYWTLSNIVQSIPAIKILMFHPHLMNTIFKNAYSESLNSKCEISHLLINITFFEEYYEIAATLMEREICDIIFEYIQIPQLQRSMCQLIQNLVFIHKNVVDSEIDDSAAAPLRVLKRNLMEKNVDSVFYSLNQDLQKEFNQIDDYLSCLNYLVMY